MSRECLFRSLFVCLSAFQSRVLHPCCVTRVPRSVARIPCSISRSPLSALGVLPSLSSPSLRLPRSHLSKHRYKDTIKDYNFGSLIRTDARDEYSEKNTIFSACLPFPWLTFTLRSALPSPPRSLPHPLSTPSSLPHSLPHLSPTLSSLDSGS